MPSFIIDPTDPAPVDPVPTVPVVPPPVDPVPVPVSLVPLVPLPPPPEKSAGSVFPIVEESLEMPLISGTTLTTGAIPHADPFTDR